MGASINNQLLRPPEQRIRPSSSSKYQEAEENVPDLPGYVAPMPTETHLSFHSEMCRDLDNLGDRWKYPQGIKILVYFLFFKFEFKSGKIIWTLPWKTMSA